MAVIEEMSHRFLYSHKFESFLSLINFDRHNLFYFLQFFLTTCCHYVFVVFFNKMFLFELLKIKSDKFDRIFGYINSNSTFFNERIMMAIIQENENSNTSRRRVVKSSEPSLYAR
jgi:hypothetical protein